jgi:iron complex outermembrane receptor protein
MFQGNLSYMDAKITQADPAAVVAGIQTGNRLRKAPRWNMALAGEYTYPLSFGEISARLDWSYRSSQYHQATNNPLTYEGGYGLLDGRLAYKSEGNRWELAAYGKNLTNKVYYNGIFIPGGAEVVGYPARKREFGGNVKINF